MDFYSLLPPRQGLTADNLTERYCHFCLCCNPWYTGTDTQELANAFNSIPKADGNVFDPWLLFLLVRQFHHGIINSWASLVALMGVERKEEQSAQKIQQYAVRLKRWMRTMHVDAYFDYLLNKPNDYYMSIPSHEPEVRDGVSVKDDHVIKSLRSGLVRGRQLNVDTTSEHCTNVSEEDWVQGDSTNVSSDKTNDILGSSSSNLHLSRHLSQANDLHISQRLSDVSSTPTIQTTSSPPHQLQGAQSLKSVSDNNHFTAAAIASLSQASQNVSPKDSFMHAAKTGLSDHWNQWKEGSESPKRTDPSQNWPSSSPSLAVDTNESTVVRRRRGRPPGARNKIRRILTEPLSSPNTNPSRPEKFEKLVHAQNTMLRAAFSHATRLPMETVDDLFSTFSTTLSSYLPSDDPSTKQRPC
ncbi:ARS binding protein Abp2 [Schizosaccharomyces japonicus yFS275]|uniref:ARS binding protein Abp2 n=1 Tax=Schizosaccharomyces japonicus (strain yFS275 / FY16936) TaxID=402676 RepID=B6K3M6_SCHJY|nr:ARS binding protein Abp2 [Schizosaccharomyces japonicus yFS275]EEB08083.2 ARS binding protein Abp2 [Schizosaccharomyces japonicus yFS275]